MNFRPFSHTTFEVFLVLFMIGLAVLFIANYYEEKKGESTKTVVWRYVGSVVTFGSLAIMLSLIMIRPYIVKMETKMAEKKDNVYEKVATAVSEKYQITDIPTKGNYWYSDNIEYWCKPVSPTSPEMVGVVNGQEIHFRVGLSKCDTDHPVANIIITQTPGQALTPDDLIRSKEETQ